MRESGQSTPVTKKTKEEFPDPNEDYATGLVKLWGKDTLKQLRLCVSKGYIRDENIQTMASKMDVLRIYNENCHKVDLETTVERMLEAWYNETLFDKNPSEAKSMLVSVLNDGRVSRRFVSLIKGSSI